MTALHSSTLFTLLGFGEFGDPVYSSQSLFFTHAIGIFTLFLLGRTSAALGCPSGNSLLIHLRSLWYWGFPGTPGGAQRPAKCLCNAGGTCGA